MARIIFWGYILFMEYPNQKADINKGLSSKEFPKQVHLRWKDIVFLNQGNLPSMNLDEKQDIKELELAEAIKLLTIALEEAIEEANQTSLAGGYVNFNWPSIELQLKIKRPFGCFFY